MKLINIIILALLVSSVNATIATAESDIWTYNNSWEQAFNSGDGEALGKLYSENAVVMPPSLEILNSPTKISQYWANQFSSGTGNFRLQTINLTVEDGVIYQTAVWIATVTSNGVATDLDGEMTNVIAKQTDGSWKIQLQSWN